MPCTQIHFLFILILFSYPINLYRYKFVKTHHGPDPEAVEKECEPHMAKEKEAESEKTEEISAAEGEHKQQSPVATV